MTERHKDAETGPLPAALLEAWTTDDEPPSDVARRMVQQWAAEGHTRAQHGAEEPTQRASDRPQRTEEVPSASYWKSTVVISVVASVVAIIGLSSLNFGPPRPAVDKEHPEFTTSARTENPRIQELEAELAEAKKALQRITSEHAALEKRFANARAAGAQGFVAQGASRVAPNKPLAIGDLGTLIPGVGGRVSIKKTKGRQAVVVEQSAGMVAFELKRVSTIEIVTPAGTLRVRGKSFSVRVPRDGRGDVTVSPKASQVVVETASGKATVGEGKTVAVVPKSAPQSPRKGGAKARQRDRVKHHKVMTF